ncbi:MAG: SAM-dependent chlorinase/fluorinase [Flavobacteriaceae bacterium]|nr:SAM-dependent chlorinase/fluorinase [Flavobacteriaceae bacterium]
MAFITLTTDFGEKDPYVGAVKGAIYQALPSARIVDISHSISPFSITEAAYIIRNAYYSFPKNTIHIIGVDAEYTPDNKHIAVLLNGHYFLCADNGIMSMITQKIVPEELVEINIHNYVISNFPVLDVFVKCATYLAEGGALSVIGKPIAEIKQLQDLQPVVFSDQKSIRGSVMYIDNYGNVVTNITKSLFDEIRKGRKFVINARKVRFEKILERYSDVLNHKSGYQTDGEKLALFNAAGFLELAIYKSNPYSIGAASTLFGLAYRDYITIDFLD